MGMGIGNLGCKVMREIILMIREMVREFINGVEQVIIKVNFWMIYVMDLVKCIGIKTHTIGASGGKACNGDRDKFGKMEI
jgi:hypothetical protein